jgi:hypothetical protein
MRPRGLRTMCQARVRRNRAGAMRSCGSGGIFSSPLPAEQYARSLVQRCAAIRAGRAEARPRSATTPAAQAHILFGGTTLDGPPDRAHSDAPLSEYHQLAAAPLVDPAPRPRAAAAEAPHTDPPAALGEPRGLVLPPHSPARPSKPAAATNTGAHSCPWHTHPLIGTTPSDMPNWRPKHGRATSPSDHDRIMTAPIARRIRPSRIRRLAVMRNALSDSTIRAELCHRDALASARPPTAPRVGG